MKYTNVYDITLVSGERMTICIEDGKFGTVGQDGYAWFAFGRLDSNFDISPDDYNDAYLVKGDCILVKAEYVRDVRSRKMFQVEDYERS